MENKLNTILDKLMDIENRLIRIENNNKNVTKESPKKIKIIKNTKKVIIQTGTIHVVKHPHVSRITGDTFDKKNIFRECKGMWTPEIKGWTIKNNHYNTLIHKLKETTKNLKIDESDMIVSKEEKQNTNIEKKEKPSMLEFLSDSD